MSLFSVTLTMFLIMNSVGHIIGYLELVESLANKRRQFIIIREMLLALAIMLLFHYLGDWFLLALAINNQTVQLAGGTLLFLIAIRMIFPKNKNTHLEEKKSEPFIFPIATPMIAGPSILTTIMIYSNQAKDATVLLSIIIAWFFSITILFYAEEIKKFIGKKTLSALERLMGLILTMIAVEMFLKGIKSLMQITKY